MGTIEDIRKLIQDLVTTDLKAMRAEMAGNREMTKLQIEALDAKFSAKIEALDLKFTAKVDLVLARMEAQHSTLMYSLDLNKRLENLERQVKPTESATV